MLRAAPLPAPAHYHAWAAQRMSARPSALAMLSWSGHSERVARRRWVGVLLLTCGGVLGCSRHPERAHSMQPTTPADSAQLADTQAAQTQVVEPQPATSSAPIRRASVAAKLRGVAMHGVGPDGSPVLEICPGERIAPCAGVELVGEIPPQLVSTAARIVPIVARGTYDGVSLQVEEVQTGTPLREQSRERYRNPCPEYQTPLPGPANGPDTLRIELERLQQTYDSRVSGIWWDRPRQTLTVRLTGDVSEVKKNLMLERGERFCIVGGAANTRAEAASKVERMHQLLERTEAIFLSGGFDEVSERLQIQLEAVDAATRKLIESEAGRDVQVHAFIELLDARLKEMPLPPARGVFPLVTNQARSSTGMHALGRFSLHADRTHHCVYLQGSSGKGSRMQPLLPFGYAVLDAPLRLVDFDGRVVAVEGETTDWGGGNVGTTSAANAAPTCGAASAWSGAPSRRSE